MKTILRFLLSIPQDKLLHYIVGALIYEICCHFMHWGIAFIVVFLVSVAKEFYDVMTGGKADIMDIAAAMLGSLTMFLINLIPQL